MNSFFNKTIDFYIDASIHVAFAVLAFVQITCAEFQLEIDNKVSFFAFFGTIVGYNFIKYDELVRVKKRAWYTHLKWIVLLSFVSLVFCGYYFFQLNRIAQIIAIGAFLLTGFYALPIVPKKTNFRNWSGVKIYLVALNWTIVTVLLPILYSGMLLGNVTWLYFIQRFFIVFVLMLIFEIVDLSDDKLSLQTIPQQVGVKKTKGIGYVVLFLCGLLGLGFNVNIQLLLLIFVIALFLFFANPNRSVYYSSLWVEAIPVLWWFVLICK